MSGGCIEAYTLVNNYPLGVFLVALSTHIHSLLHLSTHRDHRLHRGESQYCCKIYRLTSVEIVNPPQSISRLVSDQLIQYLPISVIGIICQLYP